MPWRANPALRRTRLQTEGKLAPHGEASHQFGQRPGVAVDQILRAAVQVIDGRVRHVDAHLLLPLQVARHAAAKVRPPGTLLFMSGTGGRRTAPDRSFIAALTAALPALTKSLALEVAPVRVNLIAAGFVDTPLSSSLLGDRIDERRAQLRATLPIGRVVGPADIAALAVHLMTNTAITGATFDIDGGQQLLEG